MKQKKNYRYEIYISDRICICRMSIIIIPLFVEAKLSIPQENEAINDFSKEKSIKKRKKTLDHNDVVEKNDDDVIQ